MLEQKVKLELKIELNYCVDTYGADFIFNIHAAHTLYQTILVENLQINQPINYQLNTDPISDNRYLRLTAYPGNLKITYTATIKLNHYRANPNQISEVSVRNLPSEVISYLYPSRYCQSDRLIRLAIKEFGQIKQGYQRVKAIQEWVQRQVTFTQNMSNSNTSALDTFIEQVGICRDFSHLMIALCRAVNIPARFTTGTDYGADPNLGPPDFHAYVEVYLDGGWYIFDPSGTAIPMGFIRLGTGRDAADVSFATIFGTVSSSPPLIKINAIEDNRNGFIIPYLCQDALSTDTGKHGARI